MHQRWARMILMILADIVLCVCAPGRHCTGRCSGPRLNTSIRLRGLCVERATTCVTRPRLIKNIPTAQMQQQQQQSCQGTGCAPVWIRFTCIALVLHRPLGRRSWGSASIWPLMLRFPHWVRIFARLTVPRRATLDSRAEIMRQFPVACRLLPVEGLPFHPHLAVFSRQGSVCLPTQNS